MYLFQKTPVDQLENGGFEIIGTKNEVIKLITEIIPSVTFNDSERGHYCDESYSIEISLDESKNIDKFMLYVRGNENRPISTVQEICDRLNCLTIDCSTGNIIQESSIGITSLLIGLDLIIHEMSTT